MKLTELFIGAHGAMERGEFGMAAEAAKHALQTYPDCVSAHRLLGEALLEQGLTVAAERHFRRTLEMDPVGVVPMLGMGVAAEDRGDLAGAYSWYLQAWEHNPRLTQVRDELLRLRVELGREARLHPSRAGLAAIHARAGQLERAADEWRAVLISDPRSPQARTALVEVLWRMGDDASAEVVCGDLLWQNPLNARALLLLADIAQRRGNPIWNDYAARYRAVDPEGEIAAILLECREDADLSLFCLHEVLVPYFAFDTNALVAGEDELIDQHADESAWLSMFGAATDDVVVAVAPGEAAAQAEEPVDSAPDFVDAADAAETPNGAVDAVLEAPTMLESNDDWAAFFAAAAAAEPVLAYDEDLPVDVVVAETPQEFIEAEVEVEASSATDADSVEQLAEADEVADWVLASRPSEVQQLESDEVVAESEPIADVMVIETAEPRAELAGDEGAIDDTEARPQTGTLALTAVQMDEAAFMEMLVIEAVPADLADDHDEFVSAALNGSVTDIAEMVEADEGDIDGMWFASADDVVDVDTASIEAAADDGLLVASDVLLVDDGQLDVEALPIDVVTDDADAAMLVDEITHDMSAEFESEQMAAEEAEVISAVVEPEPEPVAPPTFEELSRELDALMASLGAVGTQSAIKPTAAVQREWAPFTRELSPAPMDSGDWSDADASEAEQAGGDHASELAASTLHETMTSRRTRELDRLIASLGNVSARRASRELHVKRDEAAAQSDRLIDLRNQLLEEPASVVGIVGEVEQIIAAGRDEPYARRVLGEAYLRGGDYGLAAAQFRKAMLERLGIHEGAV